MFISVNIGGYWCIICVEAEQRGKTRKNLILGNINKKTRVNPLAFYLKNIKGNAENTTQKDKNPDKKTFFLF